MPPVGGSVAVVAGDILHRGPSANDIGWGERLSISRTSRVRAPARMPTRLSGCRVSRSRLRARAIDSVSPWTSMPTPSAGSLSATLAFQPVAHDGRHNEMTAGEACAPDVRSRTPPPALRRDDSRGRATIARPAGQAARLRFTIPRWISTPAPRGRPWPRRSWTRPTTDGCSTRPGGTTISRKAATNSTPAGRLSSTASRSSGRPTRCTCSGPARG
jgi:hypothetical protein